MDFARIIQIYVVQGFFALFFLYMAYLVLKRGKKSLNIHISSFYICVTIAGILNMIYANIFNQTIVYFLHFMTYYLYCLAMIFLLIFIIILIKPKQKFSINLQFLIIIIYGLLLLGLLLIPEGITINASTNWKPKWNWMFFLYSIIVCSVLIIIPSIYYSIKIFIGFESDYLKRKWKFFLIGISAYFFLFYGTVVSNTLNNDTFRFIWSLISLPTLIALYLIYYGIGRQLE
ncbi:MAG: hypothetical protein ACFFCV_17565 [Promethearchaeota archaeon]